MSDNETIFTGSVSFWSIDGGYGFITPLYSADILGDIFVHASSLPGRRGHKNLVKGQAVKFEIDARDGKIFAKNVRIIERNETLPALLNEQNAASARG